MTAINTTRVMLGGLVAGLVMNVGEAALHAGVLGGDAQSLITRYQLDSTPSAVPIVSLIVMTFILGIAAVWLYAAIRPRYGAGAGTAIIAGLTVWVIAHVWAAVYLGMGFANLIPPKLAYVPAAWGLIEAYARRRVALQGIECFTDCRFVSISFKRSRSPAYSCSLATAYGTSFRASPG